ALADAVRPESREAVARLHQLGLPEEGCLNLTQISDEELRAEARHRGYEHHSVRFSQAAQAALRELEGLRRRIDELVKDLQKEGLPRVGNAEPSTGRVQ
ncbi:MAG: hypothetical protein ACREA0_16490, partial [bacterium]